MESPVIKLHTWSKDSSYQHGPGENKRSMSCSLVKVAIDSGKNSYRTLVTNLFFFFQNVELIYLY